MLQNGQNRTLQGPKRPYSSDNRPISRANRLSSGSRRVKPSSLNVILVVSLWSAWIYELIWKNSKICVTVMKIANFQWISGQAWWNRRVEPELNLGTWISGGSNPELEGKLGQTHREKRSKVAVSGDFEGLESDFQGDLRISGVLCRFRTGRRREFQTRVVWKVAISGDCWPW